MATRLETAIAAIANPARIVIAEGKARTYDMGGKASTLEVAKAIADYASSDWRVALRHVRSPRRHGLAPPRRASRGEGGNDSTLDVAKAIADYAG